MHFWLTLTFFKELLVSNDSIERDENDAELQPGSSAIETVQVPKDVIDSGHKGVGGDDDWMAIQKQKKAQKKKIDTKASKGRKLR